MTKRAEKQVANKISIKSSEFFKNLSIDMIKELQKI